MARLTQACQLRSSIPLPWVRMGGLVTCGGVASMFESCSRTPWLQWHGAHSHPSFFCPCHSMSSTVRSGARIDKLCTLWLWATQRASPPTNLSLLQDIWPLFSFCPTIIDIPPQLLILSVSNWASHLSHLLHCSPAEIWALVLPWDFAIQQAVTLGCLSLLNICRPQNTLTVGAGWWRSLDNSKLGSKHIFIGCGKPLAPAIDNTSSTWNISILSQDTCHTLYVTANSTYSKTETFENTDIFSTVLQKIEPFNASCCLRTTSLHQTFQPVSHVTLCDTKPPNRMSTPWKMEDNGRHAEYCKIAWHLQVPNSLIRPMDHLALLVLQSGSWEAWLMKASPETSPWGSPITVAWNETPLASDSMWQWCFCMFLGMFLLSNLFRLTQEHQELCILSWICEHKSSVCGDRSPTKNGAVSA